MSASSSGFSFSSSLGLKRGSHVSGKGKLFGFDSSHSLLVSNSSQMSSTSLGSKGFSLVDSESFHVSGMSKSLQVSSMGSKGFSLGDSESFHVSGMSKSLQVSSMSSKGLGFNGLGSKFLGGSLSLSLGFTGVDSIVVGTTSLVDFHSNFTPRAETTVLFSGFLC
jgi:hypothetical protein